MNCKGQAAKSSSKMKRDFSVKRCALIAIDVIGTLYLLVILLLYIGTTPVDKTDDTIISVVITKDEKLSTYENLKYISEQLKSEGVIRSKTAFFLKAFLAGEFYSFQEKEYELSPNMSAADVIKVMSTQEQK